MPGNELQGCIKTVNIQGEMAIVVTPTKTEVAITFLVEKFGGERSTGTNQNFRAWQPWPLKRSWGEKNLEGG